MVGTQERTQHPTTFVSFKSAQRHFPHGPVVKTSSSSVEDAGSIPGQGAAIPHALQPKNQNLKQK